MAQKDAEKGRGRERGQGTEKHRGADVPGRVTGAPRGHGRHKTM